MEFYVFLWLIQLSEVFSWRIIPFKIQKVTNDSLQVGPTRRIFGGDEASDGQFKFMIMTLVHINGSEPTKCSSSLISPEWVLLAAHCLDFADIRAEDVIVVGGKSNLKEYLAERVKTPFNKPIDEAKFKVEESIALQIISHPKYDKRNLIHNIALIRVKKIFNGTLVKSIGVANSGTISVLTCAIFGWGTTPKGINYTLNYVENVKVFPSWRCKSVLRGAFLCSDEPTHGLTKGDAGGPLICKAKIHGVASHYVEEQTILSKEDIFTEVYPYNDWLNSVMNMAMSFKKINLKTVVVGVCLTTWANDF